jgi:hypothetical protein
MDASTLFLETLDELGRRTAPGAREYDLVRAALLLRQLLMDGVPLVDRINRDERVDIRYTVGRTSARFMKTIMEDEPLFWAIQDALDPAAAPPFVQPIALKRDAFLGEFILYIRPHDYSVRDVIAYLAHVEGGAHAGKPKDAREQALRNVTEQVSIGGYPPVARSVQAIARVVARALEPLCERLAAGDKPR